MSNGKQLRGPAAKNTHTHVGQVCVCVHVSAVNYGVLQA